MPELPEVETVRKALLNKVKNKKIVDINILYPKIFVYPSSEEVKNLIINQDIVDINRYGKWLIFVLNDYYLFSHLRMEGKYLYRHPDDSYSKHDLVSFSLTDMELRYMDVRKFGKMYLLKKDDFKHSPLNKLGLEPWDDKLTVSYLKEKYKNKSLPIKSVLLDQTIIVGIGNIYADEILFLSKINPLKKAKLISTKEIQEIINNTKEVLEKAISLGGTTIRSYTSEEGVTGKFQSNLYVHGMANKECFYCKEKIKKIKVGGRGTYYCPKCQK